MKIILRVFVRRFRQLEMRKIEFVAVLGSACLDIIFQHPKRGSNDSIVTQLKTCYYIHKTTSNGLCHGASEAEFKNVYRPCLTWQSAHISSLSGVVFGAQLLGCPGLSQNTMFSLAILALDEPRPGVPIYGMAGYRVIALCIGPSPVHTGVAMDKSAFGAIFAALVLVSSPMVLGVSFIGSVIWTSRLGIWLALFGHQDTLSKCLLEQYMLQSVYHMSAMMSLAFYEKKTYVFDFHFILRFLGLVWRVQSWVENPFCDIRMTCGNLIAHMTVVMLGQPKIPTLLALNSSQLKDPVAQATALTAQKKKLNCLQQSLVESLLEKGWSKNRSFLRLSACQLQAVEQFFWQCLRCKLIPLQSGAIIHQQHQQRPHREEGLGPVPLSLGCRNTEIGQPLIGKNMVYRYMNQSLHSLNKKNKKLLSIQFMVKKYFDERKSQVNTYVESGNNGLEREGHKKNDTDEWVG
ncbi:hypothetical protein VP01_333g3 [Puccinia sorghi]|uniref:Uncharacterized protein n=1 Tax=Puccinia sorghi TaxID=27349 RepID=A0A0L6UXY5_9BASI|nr:hypothetical protein VP01_333g3 [Puccinia sorghi]